MTIRPNKDARNTLRLPNHRRTSLRKTRSIRVFVASSFEYGTAYFAVVIYVGVLLVDHDGGWLNNSSAERAWFHALGLVYEWRDCNAPNARLFTYESDGKEPHRRKAA